MVSFAVGELVKVLEASLFETGISERDSALYLNQPGV